MEPSEFQIIQLFRFWITVITLINEVSFVVIKYDHNIQQIKINHHLSLCSFLLLPIIIPSYWMVTLWHHSKIEGRLLNIQSWGGKDNIIHMSKHFLAPQIIVRSHHENDFRMRSPGVNFINVLWAALTHRDPKSKKSQSSCQSFLCFRDLRL